MERCKNFKADVIYSGGWSFMPYITIVKQLKTKSTVIGFDNQWFGTLKQSLGALYFRLFLKPYFKFAFVPGDSQSRFAEKIGFRSQNIIAGAYCCDIETFSAAYQKNKMLKQKNYPHRFLFVGRYAKEKNIDLLCECFIDLQSESPNDWELWCLGKGELKPVKHQQIKHFGFIQAHEMGDIITNTGIFILPSSFEPWGVVLHEFAAAGFPIITTSSVGAASTFVREGVNGHVVTANNKTQLKQRMKEMMFLTEERLNLMSEKSAEISLSITPALWARNIMRCAQ